VDADTGENGHVVYALERGTRATSLFRIDPGIGNILLVDELPVNDVNTTYHVTVIARDAGLPVRSSALRVNIVVWTWLVLFIYLLKLYKIADKTLLSNE